MDRKFTATVVRATGSWYDVLHDGETVRCRIRPIAAHDFIYGYIIVWEAVRNLTELDFVAVEQVAIVAALERIRAKEVEQSKLRVRKDFLADLLSGTIESVNAVRSLAKLHGLNFDSRYRCLVARCGPESSLLQEQKRLGRDEDAFARNADRLAAAAAQAAKECGVNMVTVSQGVQVVALADLGTPPEDGTSALRRMAERLGQLLGDGADPVLVVTGKAVSSLAQVSRSYQDTQNGVHMAQASGMRDRVIFMDDFAAYQLLSEHVDRDVLRRFRDGGIGPLLAQDEKNKTQFVDTLEQYFHHNGSISDAARDMYIHRNTYIYRLEKIKHLLGTDLKNPRKLLEPAGPPHPG